MDYTGYIFKYEKSFWKVTGPKRDGVGYGKSYPVIKCNKYGKTFTKVTGFIDTYVEDQVRKGNAWKFSEVQEAVSTEGQAMGIRKRRIQFLEDKIAAYTEELARLKAIVDGK